MWTDTCPETTPDRSHWDISGEAGRITPGSKADLGVPEMETPEQKSLHAKMAIHARWAREDPRPNAQRGQRGLKARFLREAREEFPEASEAQIQRFADHAYKGH